jgi:hypothetical protein
MGGQNTMIGKIVRTGVVLTLGMVVLSACQTKDAKIDPVAGGGGLTGKWVSSDNVFTAQLDNGNFFSTANDTGEVLSEGTYIVISASEIRMNWQGKLSQQSNSANCLRQGVDVLICTDLAGKGFTLRKASLSG